MARPIEPDEDLADEPLRASRLASSAQDRHRDLGDRPGRLGRRERALVEPLGGREHPAARDDVGVAGAAAGIGGSPWFARVSGPGGTIAPGGRNSRTPPSSESSSDMWAVRIR